MRGDDLTVRTWIDRERRIHLKTIERPADGWAWRGVGGPR